MLIVKPILIVDTEKNKPRQGISLVFYDLRIKKWSIVLGPIHQNNSLLS